MSTSPISIAVRAAAAVLALGLAGSAAAAAPLGHKSAVMQCADRRIRVEADCFAFTPSTTMCTRQSIGFFGADGKALGTRAFPSAALKHADYPVVQERFGELVCVETADRKRFLVATMDNGGNCDECEWQDVYSNDGVLLGSTRDRTHGAAVERALEAASDRKGRRVLKRQAVTGFYGNNGAE